MSDGAVTTQRSCDDLWMQAYRTVARERLSCLPDLCVPAL
jgi:hypothetical protein